MRRWGPAGRVKSPVRRGPRLLSAAAAAVLLAGCAADGGGTGAGNESGRDSGGGESGGARSTARAAQGWAVPEAKVLTAADLPGFTVTNVSGVVSMSRAGTALQAMSDYRYEPPACKAKDINSLRDVQETVLSGRRVNVSRGAGQPGFVVTMLPATDVRTDVFAAAGTGDCASTTVTAGDTVTERTTTREALPTGVRAPGGFVLATDAATRTGDRRARQTAITAYLTKGGVTLLVAGQSAPGGAVDRAAFDAIVSAAAGKL